MAAIFNLFLNCCPVVAETQGYEISSEPQILYELGTYTANPGKLEALESGSKSTQWHYLKSMASEIFNTGNRKSPVTP